ncbi:MAG: serine/threonine-protein kinase, partial [Candidatus Eisenbacteria bacterium]
MRHRDTDEPTDPPAAKGAGAGAGPETDLPAAKGAGAGAGPGAGPETDLLAAKGTGAGPETDLPAAKGPTLYVVNGGAKEPAGSGLLSRGALLGRYVILRHIGSGGMGVVYQAYDPKLDRQIVVKLLRPGGGAASTSEAARVRLAREAQALAKLAHPNVVTVYDVGAVDDEVYIAMEFVDGVTLHDWLKAQRRSRSEIVQAFLAAGRGLAAAHRAGLVHRDFKPDNVLVSEDGRIRVLDFGLAMLEKHEPHTPSVAGQAGDALGTTAIDDGRGALRTPVTQVGARLGTPRYMAPEQHMGQEDVDARADQFGFCVALHHALYGVYPFAG